MKNSLVLHLGSHSKSQKCELVWALSSKGILCPSLSCMVSAMFQVCYCLQVFGVVIRLASILMMNNLIIAQRTMIFLVYQIRELCLPLAICSWVARIMQKPISLRAECRQSSREPTRDIFSNTYVAAFFRTKLRSVSSIVEHFKLIPAHFTCNLRLRLCSFSASFSNLCSYFGTHRMPLHKLAFTVPRVSHTNWLNNIFIESPRQA